MKILKLFIVVAVAFSVSSCCSDCRRNKSKVNLPLTGTEWQLVQFEGSTFVASEDSYTLNFSNDMRVSGKGDCNRLMGGYETPGNGKLQLSGMAGTRIFCPNQQTEDRFLSVLSGVDGYTIDGNMLMLFDGGELKMVFNRK